MSRYIDADNTIKAFTSVFEEYIDLTEFIEMIDKQPTADVRENVNGEWTKQTIESTYFTDWRVYECPICGRMQVYMSPFCPNCGAKMKGDNE